MSTEYYDKVSELLQNEAAFATATVIKTVGSASAKPGSKSIIGADGMSILGWVGGGCADGGEILNGGEEMMGAVTAGTMVPVLEQVPCPGLG